MNRIGRSNLRPCLSFRVVLIVGLLGGTGCATSHWVDDRTAGDLWGTNGREMGVSALPGAPAARSASGDAASGGDASDGDASDGDASDGDGASDAALDALIEVVLITLSAW